MLFTRFFPRKLSVLCIENGFCIILDLPFEFFKSDSRFVINEPKNSYIPIFSQ